MSCLHPGSCIQEFCVRIQSYKNSSRILICWKCIHFILSKRYIIYTTQLMQFFLLMYPFANCQMSLWISVCQKWNKRRRRVTNQRGMTRTTWHTLSFFYFSFGLRSFVAFFLSLCAVSSSECSGSFRGNYRQNSQPKRLLLFGTLFSHCWSSKVSTT